MTHRNKVKWNWIFLVTIVLSVLIGASHSWSATIGKDTDGGNTSTAWVDRAYALITGTYRYTAVAGDAVTQFHWRGGWGADGDELTIRMCIYDVIADVATNKIGSETTVTITSGTHQVWNSATVDVALVAGTEYCVAWKVSDAAHSFEISRGSTGVNDSTAQDVGQTDSPLPDPYVQLATVVDAAQDFYATVTNTPVGGGSRVGVLK
jgi:hypothetical protein